ncbi:hypothetical protein BOTBODRAFT_165675 [Botryobasidium botryosum FD-172 SS1]|uniref:DSBA-like thioredoxin domain-containing protein n=1 Tax=Botryobasidium botryosum (strain FD-172 SS1) TaxID=930990 RepID=A0A067MA60_BOTB1|nr:hypothetical protein BOTBODRAFT_165675 [Botryobasidium botryosum FD-172 SS1]
MTAAVAQPPPAPSRLVNLTITQDIICPWCYIGIREIQAAVALAEKNLPLRFLIEYRPFRLIPSLSLDIPISKNELYIKKFGDRIHGVRKVVKERGRALGIEFNFEGNIRQTTLSHRLLLRAWKAGGQKVQEALLDHIFQGFFERAEDPGSVEVLAGYAEAAGLMSQTDAERFLRSKELESEVEEMIRSAQMEGITGVPFTTINNTWAVSGCQSSEVYYGIFERLAKMEI